MNRQQAYVLVLVCGALVACRENQVVDPNLAPNAEAKLVNPDDDKLVDSLELDFEDKAVTLDLDGTGSSDDDGTLVEYRWLSSNTDDDGMGRGGPSPRDPDADPPAATDGGVELTTCTKATCKVTLEEQGLYHFSLWVKDDDGAFSKPSTVSVTFGTPPEPDTGADDDAGAGGGSSGWTWTGAGTCTPYDGLPDACKDCTCNECPAETSTCDETCWGLISCVANDCGGDATDTACIGSTCAAFLGGIATASATGECARTCTDACSM